MIDVIAPVAASASAAVTMVKSLLELSTIAKDSRAVLVISELQLKLADLQMQLAEIKIQHADLMLERAGLIEEISRLNKPPEMQFKDGLYYKSSDESGPYCPACFDGKNQTCRLVTTSPLLKANASLYWICHSCNAKYT